MHVVIYRHWPLSCHGRAAVFVVAAAKLLGITHNTAIGTANVYACVYLLFLPQNLPRANERSVCEVCRTRPDSQEDSQEDTSEEEDVNVSLTRDAFILVFILVA